MRAHTSFEKERGQLCPRTILAKYLNQAWVGPVETLPGELANGFQFGNTEEKRVVDSMGHEGGFNFHCSPDWSAAESNTSRSTLATRCG